MIEEDIKQNLEICAKRLKTIVCLAELIELYKATNEFENLAQLYNMLLDLLKLDKSSFDKFDNFICSNINELVKARELKIHLENYVEAKRHLTQLTNKIDSYKILDLELLLDE